MDKVENRYKEIFLRYLISKIDFNKYDEEVDGVNLSFGISSTFVSNVSSKYFNLINHFYVDKLSEDDYNIISTSMDGQLLFSVIERTYKDVLKKGDSETIMYNPPMPNHNVKNGSLVFEFVYGKNIGNLSFDDYIDNMNSQREFINNLVTKIENEIVQLFGVPCLFFVEKRI